MILAASPNTVRSLARKAGLRSADVFIKDVSQDGARATEVYLRVEGSGSEKAIDWLCACEDHYKRLSECQICGHLISWGTRCYHCPACGVSPIFP